MLHLSEGVSGVFCEGVSGVFCDGVYDVFCGGVYGVLGKLVLTGGVWGLKYHPICLWGRATTP